MIEPGPGRQSADDLIVILMHAHQVFTGDGLHGLQIDSLFQRSSESPFRHSHEQSRSVLALWHGATGIISGNPFYEDLYRRGLGGPALSIPLRCRDAPALGTPRWAVQNSGPLIHDCRRMFRLQKYLEPRPFCPKNVAFFGLSCICPKNVSYFGHAFHDAKERPPLPVARPD